MPPDLAQLLHQAAPEPTSSPDPEQLWSAGRRSRRHRRLILGFTIVAAAGLAAVAVARIDRPDPDRTVTAADGTDTTSDSTVTEDPTHGWFTVEIPATWHRATPRLTPNLTDPVEIISLGTGELPAGGDTCAQFPVAALEAMSPTDAFITVQERISPEAAGLTPGHPWDEEAGFPPRPDQFPPPDSKNVSEVVDCLAEPPVFDNWAFAFNDDSRGFHVLVAIGTQASDQTRAETWAILDSLQFDPKELQQPPRGA